MGAIGLGNGEVWGANGATVLMVLRAASHHAETDEARSHINRAIAMNGLGLSLGAVEREAERDDLRQALRCGAEAVRSHAEQLAELATDLRLKLDPPVPS